MIQFLKFSSFSNSPESKLSSIFTKLCFIILQAQIVICPTSEFHICQSGIQTALPEASRRVISSENNLLKVGELAFTILFSSRVFSFIPNQSRIRSVTFCIIFFIYFKTAPY